MNRAGAVLFLENNQRLTSHASPFKLQKLFKSAQNGSSVLTWPMKKAVSSLTHKKMFEYFHTDADNFLFLQMVHAKRLLLYNTKTIHKEVSFLIKIYINNVITPDLVIFIFNILLR